MRLIASWAVGVQDQDKSEHGTSEAHGLAGGDRSQGGTESPGEDELRMASLGGQTACRGVKRYRQLCKVTETLPSELASSRAISRRATSRLGSFRRFSSLAPL